MAGPEAPLDLTDLAGALTDPRGAREHAPREVPTPCAEAIPSCVGLREILDALRAALFPGYFCVPGVPEDDVAAQTLAALRVVDDHLPGQLARALTLVGREDACPQAETMTAGLLRRLPAIQHLLATDAQAAHDGDPAATSIEETVVCYPGVLAVTYHRVAHELHRLGAPLVPRMIAELAHSQTGIDIHPGATIGERFFIDHGTGVVIGETAVIGRRVRMYQGVTLGALSFPADDAGILLKGQLRHPVVEDDVILYAGATILGRVTIGRGSVIGGGVWLTESVPPQTRLSMNSHLTR
jgi:serine O-acetyltransferase